MTLLASASDSLRCFIKIIPHIFEGLSTKYYKSLKNKSNQILVVRFMPNYFTDFALLKSLPYPNLGYLFFNLNEIPDRVLSLLVSI